MRMWPFFGRDSSKEFPYDVNEKLYEDLEGACFSLHKGVSKISKENVSIFLFDKKRKSDMYEYAKSFVKRLKTLRHPSVLTYLDSMENDSHIYVATEFVSPVLYYLNKLPNLKRNDAYISWGILNIIKGISFLNNDAKLRHNNIYHGAVFVNNAGDWKIGEVSYISDKGDYYPQKMSQLQKYSPPETRSADLANTPFGSIDSWGLGIFIWEVYNGQLSTTDSLKQTKNIPSTLQSIYRELIAASPQKRPNALKLLENSKRYGSFFYNSVVQAMSFLEEVHIKDKEENKDFFSNISPLLNNLPENTRINKVLPGVITAFEYGCEGSILVNPLLELSKNLPEATYQQQIGPFIIKLFTSNDRYTRSLLLQNIEQVIEKLSPAVINDNLFPLLINGFMDSNPKIREQTVKSIIHLAPKLNSKNLNEEVLKHFARIQSKDEQGGIRTNTTVCLGKIAYCLAPQNRKVILVSAFLRATKDPFPPVRNAGVLALAVCQQYFTVDDVGKTILPAICPLTLDLDPSVRESTFRAIKGFLGKLEKVSENPSLREEMENEVMSTNKPVASWSGWAVTAIASKLSYKFDSLNSSDKKTTVEKTTKEEPPIQKLKSDDDVKQKTSVIESSSYEKSTKKSSVFDDVDEDSENIPDNVIGTGWDKDEDFDWDEDNWESLVEENPIEVTPVETIPVEEKRKKSGPMKLGRKVSDMKYD